MFSLPALDLDVEPRAAFAMLAARFPHGALWKDAYGELFRCGIDAGLAEHLIALGIDAGFVERGEDDCGRECFTFHRCARR